MKPNIRGSVIFMALLFLFSGAEALAFEMPSDTLIIDGEIIYIEKEEVAPEEDSSLVEPNDDLPRKRLSQHPFSIGLTAGGNLTFSSFATSLGDYQPLDHFVENTNSRAGNLFAEGDFSYRAARIETAGGNFDLSLHAGAGIGKVKINCTVFSDLREFNRDSLISMNYDRGEIFLNYFTFIEPPIGEPDTASISFTAEQMHFTTLDLPLRLRVCWSGKSALTSFFAEAGVVHRSVMASKTYDNFLVNEKGRYIEMKADEFKPMNLWRPQFSLGAEFKLPAATESSGKWFGLGAVAAFSLPKAAFNSGNLLWANISSARLGLFIRYHF